MGPPVSVALLNDYELVVRGLASMLEPFRDRVRVTELNLADGPPERPVDVALIDTFGTRDHAMARARRVVDDGRARKVMIYTWDTVPDLRDDVLAAGLSGMVIKSCTAEELVTAIERVAGGEIVLSEGPPTARRSGGFEPPGPLSERETEVLVLLAQGLTNRQIAESLFLSPETVKTYVSRLYAKLGVTNRASAVVWAMERDLGPPMRDPRQLFERTRVGHATSDA
jgi:DNA-binding NarL/FixJ family response regulator